MAREELMTYRRDMQDEQPDVSDTDVVHAYLDYAESLDMIADELYEDELPAIRAQMSELDRLMESASDAQEYNTLAQESDVLHEMLNFMQLAYETICEHLQSE